MTQKDFTMNTHKQFHKTFLLLNTLYCIFNSAPLFCNDPAVQKITFQHQFVKQGDGMALVFDGKNIGNMITAVRKIKSTLYGVIDKTTKERVGKYTFNGMKHSLSSLAELEYTTQQDFSDLLAEIINDFYKELEPLIKYVQGTQKYTVPLIEEWILRANRHDSDIMIWDTMQPGQELHLLQQTLRSLTQFQTFCQDLLGYIESLIHSCPKGCKQFRELAQHH